MGAYRLSGSAGRDVGRIAAVGLAAAFSAVGVDGFARAANASRWGGFFVCFLMPKFKRN